MSDLLDRDVVLAAFDDDRSRHFKIKELGDRIGVDHTLRPALRQLVRALVDAGDLVAHPGRRFSLASEGTLVEGVVQRHKRGFGWLLPDVDGLRDAYLPANEVAGLFDGDRILCRISPSKRGPVGKVIKILARSQTTRTGTLVRERRATWVELDGVAAPLLIPDGDEGGADGVEHGSVVEVVIERYPTAVTSAVGRVVRVLGKEGDIAVQVERLITEGHIVRPFSPEAEAEADALPEEPSADDCKGRLDLTKMPLCTIDGATAKDFDDAVHAAPTSGGNLRVTVAIADVAHYVREGSALDVDAVARGTSVYYPGHCIPMLPEALSNGLCSLNPKVLRLCMVCQFDVADNGRVSKVKLSNGFMRSHARLTYEQVHRFFDGDPAARKNTAERNAIPPKVQESLEHLRQASRALRKRRLRRGSMDFDLPESVILTDEQGEPVAIASRERRESHRLIEDLMIAANEAVASHMEAHDQPCVFRIHEPPDAEKLDRFFRLARSVAPNTKTHDIAAGHRDKGGKGKGDKGKKGRDEGTSSALVTALGLSRLLGRLDKHRLKNALDFLLLRAMMRARYSAFNVGHFGLGSEAYAHFTSPIRRYPDLMTHRLVKAHLRRPRHRYNEAQLDDANDQLESTAGQCSDLERQAMDVERKIDALYCAWFMKDRVGEEFEGNVSGCAEFAVFVRLDDPEVEGSVHVAELGKDYFQYDELRMRLTGERSRYSVGVGDRVRVQLVRVDLSQRRIELRLLKVIEREGHATDDPPPGRVDGEERSGQHERPRGKKTRGRGARRRDEQRDDDAPTARGRGAAGRKSAASKAGGSKAGGSKTGGSKAGGSKTGGSKAGGSKTGGSKAGGSKTGGSKTSGNKTRGKTSGRGRGRGRT
jgi:ribonuclease R